MNNVFSYKWEMKVFPWIETVHKKFIKSFPGEYKFEDLQFLEKNVEEEMQNIWIRKTKRKKILFETLGQFYNQFCWKIKWNETASPMKTTCVHLLSHLTKLGIFLSHGDTESKWIARVVTAIKLFPGEDDLLYDALLRITQLNKKFQEAYGIILKKLIFCSQPKCKHPETYFKYILLLRRLKSLLQNKSEKIRVHQLGSTLKPPPDTTVWLASHNLTALSGIKVRFLGKQLMSKTFTKEVYKNLRKVLFPKIDAQVTEKRSSMADTMGSFIIDNAGADFQCEIFSPKLNAFEADVTLQLKDNNLQPSAKKQLKRSKQKTLNFEEAMAHEAISPKKKQILSKDFKSMNDSPLYDVLDEDKYKVNESIYELTAVQPKGVKRVNYSSKSEPIESNVSFSVKQSVYALFDSKISRDPNLVSDKGSKKKRKKKFKVCNLVGDELLISDDDTCGDKLEADIACSEESSAVHSTVQVEKSNKVSSEMQEQNLNVSDLQLYNSEDNNENTISDKLQYENQNQELKTQMLVTREPNLCCEPNKSDDETIYIKCDQSIKNDISNVSFKNNLIKENVDDKKVQIKNKNSNLIQDSNNFINSHDLTFEKVTEKDKENEIAITISKEFLSDSGDKIIDGNLASSQKAVATNDKFCKQECSNVNLISKSGSIETYLDAELSSNQKVSADIHQTEVLSNSISNLNPSFSNVGNSMHLSSLYKEYENQQEFVPESTAIPTSVTETFPSQTGVVDSLQKVSEFDVNKCNLQSIDTKSALGFPEENCSLKISELLNEGQNELKQTKVVCDTRKEERKLSEQSKISCNNMKEDPEEIEIANYSPEKERFSEQTNISCTMTEENLKKLETIHLQTSSSDERANTLKQTEAVYSTSQEDDVLGKNSNIHKTLEEQENSLSITFACSEDKNERGTVIVSSEKQPLHDKVSKNAIISGFADETAKCINVVSNNDNAIKNKIIIENFSEKLESKASESITESYDNNKLLLDEQSHVKNILPVENENNLSVIDKLVVIDTDDAQMEITGNTKIKCDTRQSVDTKENMSESQSNFHVKSSYLPSENLNNARNSDHSSVIHNDLKDKIVSLESSNDSLIKSIASDQMTNLDELNTGNKICTNPKYEKTAINCVMEKILQIVETVDLDNSFETAKSNLLKTISQFVSTSPTDSSKSYQKISETSNIIFSPLVEKAKTYSSFTDISLKVKQDMTISETDIDSKIDNLHNNESLGFLNYRELNEETFDNKSETISESVSCDKMDCSVHYSSDESISCSEDEKEETGEVCSMKTDSEDVSQTILPTPSVSSEILNVECTTKANNGETVPKANIVENVPKTIVENLNKAKTEISDVLKHTDDLDIANISESSSTSTVPSSLLPIVCIEKRCDQLVFGNTATPEEKPEKLISETAVNFATCNSPTLIKENEDNLKLGEETTIQCEEVARKDTNLVLTAPLIKMEENLTNNQQNPVIKKHDMKLRKKLIVESTVREECYSPSKTSKDCLKEEIIAAPFEAPISTLDDDNHIDSKKKSDTISEKPSKQNLLCDKTPLKSECRLTRNISTMKKVHQKESSRGVRRSLRRNKNLENLELDTDFYELSLNSPSQDGKKVSAASKQSIDNIEKTVQTRRRTRAFGLENDNSCSSKDQTSIPESYNLRSKSSLIMPGKLKI